MATLNLQDFGQTSAQALHAVYEQRAEDWRREHLGASLIGHDCDRFLWLSFRWAQAPQHRGQLLRLFARGEREEAWIVEDLRKTGFTVQDRDPLTGEQFTVRWGHLGGSCDGRVLGLLEAPKTEHVLEVKTFNAKQFDWLKKNGVKKAKPQHWVQMQVYMRGLQLERAYYVAVCKDTDELHTERVKLDVKAADAAIGRALAIISAPEPGKRLDATAPPCVLVSRDGTRWPCQYFNLCHGEAWPAKSCRTCISAEPLTEGSWLCLHRDLKLDGRMQREACAGHVTIPAAVNAQVVAVDEARRLITFAMPSGKIVEGA